MSTKLAWLVFGMLLVLCAIIIVLFCIGEVPGLLSTEHPDHASMQQGRDGIETQSHIKWLGLAFGILQLCFATCLIGLCLNKQGRLKIFKTPLVICMLLCIAAFVSMMAAYIGYARQGSGPLFGSFPLPTALMLYALWPMPVFFTIVYVMYYDKAIFTAEDDEKFQALVKSRHENTEEAD